MGTITVAIADDAERWLRKAAGKGKGKLGGKITEAVQLLRGFSEKDDATARLREMMRRGSP